MYFIISLCAELFLPQNEKIILFVMPWFMVHLNVQVHKGVEGSKQVENLGHARSFTGTEWLVLSH